MKEQKSLGHETEREEQFHSHSLRIGIYAGSFQSGRM
jgi:hypothetical protein